MTQLLLPLNDPIADKCARMEARIFNQKKRHGIRARLSELRKFVNESEPQTHKEHEYWRESTQRARYLIHIWEQDYNFIKVMRIFR